jgi:hypothetical protein
MPQVCRCIELQSLMVKSARPDLSPNGRALLFAINKTSKSFMD